MKIKPLLPALKEKKRYIAYDAMIDTNASSADIRNAIKNALFRFMGELNYGRAGVRLVDSKGKNGVIRVNNDYVDEVKTGLMMVDNVNRKKTVVRSMCVSGMLHKARHEIGG